MDMKNVSKDIQMFHSTYSGIVNRLGGQILASLNCKDRPGTLDVIVSPLDESKPISESLQNKINKALPNAYDGAHKTYPIHIEYQDEGYEIQ